jgi:hypothetical protein
MSKRTVGKTVLSSLLITSVLGINSFAYEGDLYVETLETVPVNSEVLFIEDDNSMVIYDAIEPVEYVNGSGDDNDADSSEMDDDSGHPKPQGESTEVQEASGVSSFVDASELDIYSGNIIDMILPVVPEATYDFVMDPRDVLSRYSKYKDTYRKSSIYFTSHCDGIIHKSTSDAALAINRSTVPVLLYVTLEVENQNDWPVRFTDIESVEDNDEINVAFELVPVSYHKSQDGVDDISMEISDSNEAQDTKEIESPFGNKDITEIEGHRVSIDKNGKAELSIFIPANMDNFEKYGDGYILKNETDFMSYGWVVNSACNTKADWSDIVEKANSGENINIHITYQMRVLTEDEAAEIGDDVVVR